MTSLNPRVPKEFKKMHDQSEKSGVCAALAKKGDYSHWIGTIKGPLDTPYSDGTFNVGMQILSANQQTQEIHLLFFCKIFKIPAQYPFQPPKNGIYVYQCTNDLLMVFC
eukprot:UN01815